jgi:hydrogenase expression/formation protein HypE
MNPMENSTHSTLTSPSCPTPLRHDDRIVIGHGSGGRMTADLINRIFQPYFSNPILLAGNDFASLISFKGKIVMSTDSHIVSPLFFPGGDIGKLAVCGTVNDVSMSGAIPKYLTVGFIIEEGFKIQNLEKIAQSMQSAAQEAGVEIVAGDTKVIEKGKGDGVFINTTGLGVMEKIYEIGGEKAQPGDAVLISGTIGEHGMAVLSARGDLGLETQIQSDVAPLNGLIHQLLQTCPDIHVLRDPTRGGLATTLNEIACQSNICIQVVNKSIPVQPAVRTACEMLGFDPLYIANEGKVIVILPDDQATTALKTIRSHPYGKHAQRIGIVKESPKRRVLLLTDLGTHRILETLSGEMLPRIC